MNQKARTKRDLARTESTQAIERLRKNYLKVGDTVYVFLRRISRSGTCRWIDLYTVREKKPLRITWSAAKALATRYDSRREAIRVEGCGFDCGHSLVHDLAWRLFGNSDALDHRWL
ncbi:hypothetical protein OH491_12465 [Termitidicoccus mucosus]|uniref:Uncharacterized protein n=1 Tax=Termitidicoccus mucosus TaxID=1184151 RepID=A0A178IIQ7_9BACT|nr:hypothetical protein AW736_15000 [Opitutaceae bacterium TSB47]